MGEEEHNSKEAKLGLKCRSEYTPSILLAAPVFPHLLSPTPRDRAYYFRGIMSSNFCPSMQSHLSKSQQKDTYLVVEGKTISTILLAVRSFGMVFFFFLVPEKAALGNQEVTRSHLVSMVMMPPG